MKLWFLFAAVIEKSFFSAKKVTFIPQVAVENQIRNLRHRWEIVKRSDLSSFLVAPVRTEMTPQLEASITEMTRSLKSLFSVLFCTNRGEPSVSGQQLATISQIKQMLQTQLADFEDYLLVKGQRNVTMTAYPFLGIQIKQIDSILPWACSLLYNKLNTTRSVISRCLSSIRVQTHG